MKYAKIECGRLIVPRNYPSYIVVDGKKLYNPTEEQYLAAGYLPLIESEPEEHEGYVAEARYAVNEEGTAIVQTWLYLSEPIPEEDML